MSLFIKRYLNKGENLIIEQKFYFFYIFLNFNYLILILLLFTKTWYMYFSFILKIYIWKNFIYKKIFFKD